MNVTKYDLGYILGDFVTILGYFFSKKRLVTLPGLPDGIFSTQKILILGKFWRDLKRKILVYFRAIWYIL
jgi:hypothetical protein